MSETPVKKTRKPRTNRPIVGFLPDGTPVEFPEGTTDVRDAMAHLQENHLDALQAEGVQLYRDLGLVRARAPKRERRVLVRD